MRYCADTWFLLQLCQGDETAERIFRETIDGKSSIVIPTMSILELIRLSIMRGGSLSGIDAVLGEMKVVQKIQIISMDEVVAKEAAKVSASYGISTGDSVIAATCKLSECDRLLSDDSHLKGQDKKRYLKTESW